MGLSGTGVHSEPVSQQSASHPPLPSPLPSLVPVYNGCSQETLQCCQPVCQPVIDAAAVYLVWSCSSLLMPVSHVYTNLSSE